MEFGMIILKCLRQTNVGTIEWGAIFFDTGVPFLLELDETAPTSKATNLASPVRLSPSFGVAPQQTPPIVVAERIDPQTLSL